MPDILTAKSWLALAEMIKEYFSCDHNVDPNMKFDNVFVANMDEAHQGPPSKVVIEDMEIVQHGDTLLLRGKPTKPIYEQCLSETTFRKMMVDYIRYRDDRKKEMFWTTRCAPRSIKMHLEEKPHTQESMGFEIQPEVIEELEDEAAE